MTSAVLKQWKPELKAMGFAYRNGMFMYERGEPRFLPFGVSIQKNVHGATYKVNPSILFKNPFLEGAFKGSFAPFY